MKVFSGILILLLLIISKAYGQCYPPPPNTTATITGLHTSDVNLPSGSIIYVAPSATVTGNIFLNNSSLYNCGTILSRKVVVKQSVTNWMHTIQNSNLMICDSVLLDSLGHLHNNDSLICNFFKMGYSASADNYYYMDVKHVAVESGSWLSSLALMKADFIRIKDLDSRFILHYGRGEIKKLLQVDSLAVIHGVGFVCVDSCFINKGLINLGNSSSMRSYIKVSGTSQNYGLMFGFDFCDYSGRSGPDLNYGTLNSITFCETDGIACNYYSTEIIEKENPIIKVGIYPNPADEELFIIDADKYDLEDAKLEIYNSLGQMVFSNVFSNRVSVSGLAEGFYSLRIKQRSGQILYSNFIKK